MLHHRIIVILILYISIFFSSISPLFARVAGVDDVGKESRRGKVEPPPIGNFALRTTQQPGPLFGFGQNINSKGDLQVYASPNQIGGHSFTFSELMLLGIYAFTDVCSLLVATPVALSRTSKTVTQISSLIPLRTEIHKMNAFVMEDDMSDLEEQEEETVLKSSGLEDIIVQFEYVIVDKADHKGELQTTLVSNIMIPTGSTKKQPNTGLGSPAFFFGTTTNYQSLFWYVYGSVGGLICTKNHGLKFGNAFMYQVGCEGIIGFKSKKFIVAWLFELFGVRTQKNSVMNQKDPNSGSHLIFAAPSLWFSTSHFVFQIGVGVPVYQKLTGVQNKTSYFVNTNIAWTFNIG